MSCGDLSVTTTTRQAATLTRMYYPNVTVISMGHTKIRRHHGTHGTDFIGCRRDEGGAINWCHVLKQLGITAMIPLMQRTKIELGL